MFDLVQRLWRGQMPLEIAVWRYAVAYALAVNLVTSGLFLMLVTRDADPVLLALAYALPLPYNLLALVGVWRSAARYDGPKKWADLAQIGTLVWMLVLSLT